MGRADLVDRGASGAKIVHHGARDRGRIGRHAFFHDTMIAGEHRDERPVDRRLRLPLPSGQEPGDFLEPPERPRRFGQLRLARADSVARRLRGPGHRGNEIADRVKRRFCGGHRDLREHQRCLLIQRGRRRKWHAATRLAFCRGRRAPHLLLHRDE